MRPSGMAINQEVYLTECVQKRLIQNNHRQDQYVFWSAMAFSHYTASVTKWRDDNYIQYVPKKLNVANVSEPLFFF